MRGLALFLALLGSPVMAETGYSCAFTVACEVAGDCEPVEILTEIAVSAEDGEWIFLSATAAARPALRISAASDETQVFTAHLDGVDSTLMTINANGTAMRSLHHDGTEAATYFGVCEEVTQ